MFYLYIYDSSGTKIAQSESITVANVSRKINEIGTCTISFDLSNEIAKSEFIKKENIFDLFIEENGVEKRLIKGYVRGKQITQNNIQLTIEDMLYLSKRRFLRTSKTYGSKTYKFILEDIFSYINGISNTGLSIDCDITDTTSVTLTRGISLLKILQDLSLNGYEFKIENNVVIFKQSSGIDRTQANDNFFEYIYDADEPYGKNIATVQLVDNLDDFANGVIDNTDSYDNISDNILFEHYVNDSIDRTEYVNEHSEIIGDYVINVKSDDFFETDIGDEVNVYINTGSELMFFDGSMKVVEKTLQVSNMLQVSIKLAKNKVNTKDFLEEFRDLKSRIGKLET